MMTSINLHEVEIKKRPWHWLKELIVDIGIIVGASFFLAGAILIHLKGAVYWYENYTGFLIGDYIVSAFFIWLGIDRLKDDIKGREHG